MGNGLATQTDNHHAIDVGMAGKARQHLLAHVGIGLHIGTARVEHDVHRSANLTGHYTARLTGADACGQNQDMVTDARTALCTTVAPELESLPLLGSRLISTHLPVISSQFAVVVAQLALQVLVVHPSAFCNVANESAQTLTIFDNLTANGQIRQSNLMTIRNILHSFQNDILAAFHEADILSFCDLSNCSDNIVCAVHQQGIYFHFLHIHAIPKSSISNISVEPPGMPGWENLP